MNFKFIILILSLLFFNTAFSQKKEMHIQYEFYFQDYYPEERQISVITNHKESLSTVTRTIMYKEIGAASFEPKSWDTHFFKTKDSIFFKEDMDRKKYFVAEMLNQFKWELTGNVKTILDYNCQEAKTTYRGRDYIAFFTTAIPFKAAPWKFHGLPGVLLSVVTTDGRIKIEAQSLEIKSYSGDVKNPFTNIEEWMKWGEFKKINAESWEAFKNKVTSQKSSLGKKARFMGKPRVSPGLRMEIIVEGNGGYEKP